MGTEDKINNMFENWLKKLEEKPISAGIQAFVVIFILRRVFKGILRPLINEVKTIFQQDED